MLRPRQRFGKYRIERKVAEGGFGVIYAAVDTIEGVRVALKVPYPHLVDDETLASFRAEARLAARLDHPNVLPLKTADFVEGQFVVATMLGRGTLEDRMRHRMSTRTALHFGQQMIEAVAYAHEQRIIHCDIKPDNFILFDEDRLRLTDFGIAKFSLTTIEASGAGTIGYVAPEQAVGKPSPRSDVFSLGLVLYRMLSGELPEWPYEWPLPGYERVRRLHPDLIALLRRALHLDPRRRFHDATRLRSVFRKAKQKALRHVTRRQQTRTGTQEKRDWQRVRQRQFQRLHGTPLEARYSCSKCSGPVGEAMQACPWCGAKRTKHNGDTRFPLHCPRCNRGLKSDWRYCPWCYGPGFDANTTREYPDRRYTARCAAPGCDRRDLMAFMRYCPWCRRKIRRKWALQTSAEKCSSCGWGVAGEFWSHCPWCSKILKKK